VAPEGTRQDEPFVGGEREFTCRWSGSTPAIADTLTWSVNESTVAPGRDGHDGRRTARRPSLRY
jgi:hypothetical protein